MATLLFLAAINTRCAATEAADEPAPSSEGPSEIFQKSADPRVTYFLLIADPRPPLGRAVQTAYLGGYGDAFVATPGNPRDERAWSFLPHDGMRYRPVTVASPWVSFVDQDGRHSYHTSTCDGEVHSHVYPTWYGYRFIEVVVQYYCVPVARCERAALCNRSLTANPAFCASAAR